MNEEPFYGQPPYRYVITKPTRLIVQLAAVRWQAHWGEFYALDPTEEPWWIQRHSWAWFGWN